MLYRRITAENNLPFGDSCTPKAEVGNLKPHDCSDVKLADVEISTSAVTPANLNTQ